MFLIVAGARSFWEGTKVGGAVVPTPILHQATGCGSSVLFFLDTFSLVGFMGFFAKDAGEDHMKLCV